MIASVASGRCSWVSYFASMTVAWKAMYYGCIVDGGGIVVVRGNGRHGYSSADVSLRGDCDGDVRVSCMSLLLPVLQKPVQL